MPPARKIGIIIGSKSDLPQCIYGLRYLDAAQRLNVVKVSFVRVNSIHRNTPDVLKLLEFVHLSRAVDALVIGAGLANHLTGTCDAYLRHTLKNDLIVVFGVAFENPLDPGTQAASLSITKVPGTQVVFNNYIGADGFLQACMAAAEGYSVLPKINLPLPKPGEELTLEQAIAEAETKIKK